MKVTVNGQPCELDVEATVADVVARFSERRTGVAVARNDAVVAKGSWAATRLEPGDRVEMLTAVQGG